MVAGVMQGRAAARLLRPLPLAVHLCCLRELVQVASADEHDHDHDHEHSDSARCPGVASETLVDVQGQSGTFTIYNADAGKDDGIMISIDELKELDASGKAVGTSGPMDSKHSINSFATQAFTIADPVDDVLPGSTVSARRLSFSSPLNTMGEIHIDTYIIKSCGRVGPPGEEWDVVPGDLKWNIQLKNWTWCGCQKSGAVASGAVAEELGDMIDVVISVKGKNNSNVVKLEGSNTSFGLGGTSALQLSRKVQLDGGSQWVDMPAGFPSVSLQGSSSTFTFRFPKFAQDALYDPVMTGISPLRSELSGGFKAAGHSLIGFFILTTCVLSVLSA